MSQAIAMAGGEQALDMEQIWICELKDLYPACFDRRDRPHFSTPTELCGWNTKL